MSARKKLLDYVERNQAFLDMPINPETGHAVDDPQAHVGRLLDAFAHELAERIRQEARQYGEEDGQAMNLAADLIDPKERA